ncbi:MAG: hypothetical protein JXB60_01390 [Candidatus Cloacimonetes bacterium]|nr:hypothetical protein [Candidatus Cloacimonadota bacterium]
MSQPRNKILLAFLWFARIVGLVYTVLILLFFLAYLFPPGEADFSWRDGISFFFFPFCVCAGLIISWKWSGIGAITTLLGLIGFHVSMRITGGAFDLNPFIDFPAIPAVIFIIYWLLHRK